MKFKTNHSPGPFSIQEENEEFNCLIIDAMGYTIAEQWSISSDVVDAANLNLFKAAPVMLEYMMDRARNFASWISNGTSREGEKEELERILAILKDAGVEVECE